MENSKLFLVDERIKSFKNWPFSDKDKCNVQRMAAAGFYSISTGDDDADSAKCFLCGKELDGWEPADDPWAEHNSHAPKCAIVQFGKNDDELILPEFLSIVKQYMINNIDKYSEMSLQKIEEKAIEIEKLFKRKVK